MKERFGLEALDAGEVQTAGDLYLTCNTGEEGLGDLKGMKTFVADVKDKVKALVALGGSRTSCWRRWRWPGRLDCLLTEAHLSREAAGRQDRLEQPGGKRVADFRLAHRTWGGEDGVESSHE